MCSIIKFERPTLRVPFSLYPERTFAERLKKTRIERGLEQTELSKKAGLAKDLIWRWENGGYGPRKWALSKVAKVLSVSPDYLLHGTSHDERDAA